MAADHSLYHIHLIPIQHRTPAHSLIQNSRSDQHDFGEYRGDVEAGGSCHCGLPAQVLSGFTVRDVNAKQIYFEFIYLLASSNKL